MGNAPAIDYLLILPLLIMLGGAVVGVLIEAIVARSVRFVVQVIFTGFVLVSSLVVTVILAVTTSRVTEGVGALMLDGPTWVTWMLVLAFSLLSLALIGFRGSDGSPFAAMGASVPGSQAEREATLARSEHTEVFPIVLFSVFGMMLFPAANDLLMLFVALEVLSLPLYLLTGLARRRRLVSQEASLKYFMLGALSSAFLLYGIVLTYGYAGSFTLRAVDAAISANQQSMVMLIVGMGLIIVGLLFKIGAVPFHSWVPDVYLGAPTPVTAFMAVCTKLAALIAMLRVLYVAFGGMRWDWQLALAIIAAVTMALGAVIGLAQRDVKRMLAYSSIAHAGFLLVGVVGALTKFSGLRDGQMGSVESVFYYLIAYGLATMGAFSVVMVVRNAQGEATGMSAWEGLGRSNPLLASAMTIFLLSMTGIPLTAGFLGKVFAFTAAWRGGYPWLVAVAVAFSVVTAAFYLRLVWVMFFNEPHGESEFTDVGVGVVVVIAFCTVGTLVLGLFPNLIIDLLTSNSVFLR